MEVLFDSEDSRSSDDEGGGGLRDLTNFPMPEGATPSLRRASGLGHPMVDMRPVPEALYGPRGVKFAEEATAEKHREVFETRPGKDVMWNEFTLEHLIKAEVIKVGDPIMCRVHTYCKWTGSIAIQENVVGIISDPMDWPKRRVVCPQPKFHKTPEDFVLFVVDQLSPSLKRDVSLQDCWQLVFVKPWDYDRLLLLSYLRQELFDYQLSCVSAMWSHDADGTLHVDTTSDDEAPVKSVLKRFGLELIEVRRVKKFLTAKGL
jgi:hypothetical protein